LTDKHFLLVASTKVFAYFLASRFTNTLYNNTDFTRKMNFDNVSASTLSSAQVGILFINVYSRPVNGDMPIQIFIKLSPEAKK